MASRGDRDRGGPIVVIHHFHHPRGVQFSKRARIKRDVGTAWASQRWSSFALENPILCVFQFGVQANREINSIIISLRLKSRL